MRTSFGRARIAVMSDQTFVERIAAVIQTSANARQIFGDPVERDGATIIPVARVQWGFGGGGLGHGVAERGGGDTGRPCRRAPGHHGHEAVSLRAPGRVSRSDDTGERTATRNALRHRGTRHSHTEHTRTPLLRNGIQVHFGSFGIAGVRRGVKRSAGTAHYQKYVAGREPPRFRHS